MTMKKMQFDAECTDDVEDAYDESRSAMEVPTGLLFASPIMASSNGDRTDLDSATKVVIYCSLASGLPFPGNINVNDVLRCVQDAFDVELTPNESCLAGELLWEFQCVAADVGHIVDEEIVVSQQRLCFKRNACDQPQLVQVWYATCDGSAIPSTVTANLIVNTVKTRGDIDILPVPDAAGDTVAGAGDARTSIQFLCEPSAVAKLQGELTARIVVKRIPLKLDVGTFGGLPAPPGHGNSSVPSANIPFPAPAAVDTAGADPSLAPAVVVAREAQAFDTLREAFEIGTDAPRDCDASVAFADQVLNALCQYFSFEFKKFDSKFTHFVGPPALLHVPPEYTNNYSTALFTLDEVTAALLRLEGCVRAEGEESVLPDLSAIHSRWAAFVEMQRQAVVTLGAECQKVFHNTDNAEVREVLTVLMAISTAAPTMATMSACWCPLQALMRCAERYAADSLLALQIINILGLWNRFRPKVIEEYQWFETRCSRILKSLCPVNLDKLVYLTRKYDRVGADFSSRNVVALCGPTGVGKSTMIHYMHGALFREKWYHGALRVHLEPYYLEPPEADLSAVKTNPFGESETIEVNASTVEHGDSSFVVLDTPGFGETKGVELDVVNGLNISAALKACLSVRLVVVLSDNCLGDKLLGDNTVKDCSRTVIDMITSPEHVDKFSYLFTKMDKSQGAAIPGAFETNLTRLSQNDVDIRPLWQDIAAKTKPRGMVACPLRDSPAERQEMLSYLFNEDRVISTPDAAFGLCIPRRSREALILQLNLHRASVQKALEKHNLSLLCFRLRQLRSLCAEPKLAQLPECADALQACAQLVVTTIERQFALVEAILLSSAAPALLIPRDRAELVNALSSIVVFERVRRECLAVLQNGAEISSHFRDRDLAHESMELMRGYIETSVLWLQDYSASCTNKHEMEAIRNTATQLIGLHRNLSEQTALFVPLVHLLSAVLPLSADPVKCAGLCTLAPVTVVSIVTSVQSALAVKYTTCIEACDLVGGLTALHSAQHLVDVFKPLLFELHQPMDERFYLDLKADFSSKIASMHRQSLSELPSEPERVRKVKTQSAVPSTDCDLSKLQAIPVCDVTLVRRAIVAFCQLQDFLSAANKTGGKGKSKGHSEFHKHLGDHDVPQCLSDIESAAVQFMQGKTALFIAVTSSVFQAPANKIMLQVHVQNVQAVADLPWPTCAGALQACAEQASDHFNALCHQLWLVVSSELNHLTLVNPRECHLDVLRSKVLELRDSAYFHKKMHLEVRATALIGIAALQAQLAKQKAHDVGRIATVSFAAGVLLEVAHMAVAAEDCPGTDRESDSNGDSPTPHPPSAASVSLDAAATTVTDIRAQFSRAFFANGVDQIVPFYNSLRSDYDSISGYMLPSAAHFSCEEKYVAFLSSCSEAQWCFPSVEQHLGEQGFKEEKAEQELAACNEATEPSQQILQDVLALRTMQLGAHVSQLKGHVQASFAWLFVEDIASQLRVWPFPIPLAAGNVTVATLVEVLEYLCRYNAQSAPAALFDVLVRQLVVLGSVMQQLLACATTEKYALENMRALTKELECFDRYLAPEQKFKQIGNDARARLVLTIQQVESAVENHDFHRVAQLLSTVDPADEYHATVVKLLVAEVKSLIDTIFPDASLFSVLVRLHNAFLFVGDHLRKKENMSAISFKLRVVEEQLTAKISATVAPTKGGNLMQSASALQFINELLSGYDAERSVMTCAGGAFCETSNFCCFQCGAANIESAECTEGGKFPAVSSSGTATCSRCATVQFVGVRSDLSQAVKQLHQSVRVQFDLRVRDVEDKLAVMNQMVVTVCEGGCVDLDTDCDDDDDFDDLMSSTGAGTASDSNFYKKFRWMKQASADLAVLSQQPAAAQVMNFAGKNLDLVDTLDAAVTPLLDKARCITENFDVVAQEFTAGADNSPEMFQAVRDALHKVDKCRRLLSKAHFAAHRKPFLEYHRSLQYAEERMKRTREEAIERGDLNSLIAVNGKQRIPSVQATLQAKYAHFEETLRSGDLVKALDLARMEGLCWIAYSKGPAELALHQLIVRFGQLLPAQHQLTKSRMNELEVLRAHHLAIIAFVRFGYLFEQVLPEATSSTLSVYAKQANQILENTFGTFCKFSIDIGDILTALEGIIPTAAECAYTCTAVVSVKDVQRFQRMWSEVTAFGDVFAFLTTERTEMKLNSHQELQRTQIHSLCEVDARLKALGDRCYEVLQLPFQNVKTDTQNRTDKDAFFSLVYLCYTICDISRDEEQRVQQNKSITANIEEVSELCKRTVSQIGEGASMEARGSVCEGFNKTVSNLISIQDTFESFSDRTRTMLTELRQLFVSRIGYLADRAYLSETKWVAWKNHIPAIAKELILLKSIARSIPAYKTEVEDAIAVLLRRYKDRCCPEEVYNDFIARLGVELAGSTSNGTGQQIIEDSSEFGGYKNQLRNLQFERVGLDSVLQSITDFHARSNLRILYKQFTNRYWDMVEKGLPKPTRRAYVEGMPTKVKDLAQLVVNASDPDVVVEGLLSIVVYCFAYWTLHDLKGFDTTPSSDSTQQHHYLTQPHPGQVIVVLRLLGLDAPGELVAQSAKVGKPPKSMLGTAKEWLMSAFVAQSKCTLRIKNHLAQVRTGEGKSIVLAITATVLALVGFDVDIACYSEYLTERDRGAFQFMFDAFVVTNGRNPIQYNTFKTLCENILKSKGDIRELMANTILGKHQNLARPNTAPVTRHRVLLADEVDVLFGSNFFGRSYNVLASLRGSAGEKEIVDLIRLIWTFRDTKMDSVWHNELLPSAQYKACLERFKEWPSLVENVAKRMLHDARDTEHKVDDVDSLKGIGYYDDDNVMTYSRRDGYKTLFAYMRENELDKTKISDKMVLDEMNFLINAGTLSYAELPKLYSVVLGVTGTLTTLSDEENQLLDTKYNIKKRTVMPSAYPHYQSNVPLFQGKLGVDVTVSDSMSYFQNIADEVNRRISDGNGKPRAVLVFFQKESTLEDFWNSDCFRDHVASALKLVKNTSPVDRDGIIARSVEEGRVTLLIAPYGRGTDFTYNNRELDERGGIHVIQTFLSEETSEEIQMMGRTMRQGHPGTFSMVLGDSDLETGCLSRREVAELRSGDDIHKLIKSNRAINYRTKCQQKEELATFMLVEHRASQELLRHLWENNLPEVKRLIQERNLSRIEFVGVVSRTVILLDGTCSMSGFFNKCKTTIKEMLKRIAELLAEKNVTCGFEVQFVVYRNYTSLSKVLQPSGWASDPEELFGFIDSTRVDGGCGNEAIEMGFWHVNQQIDKGVGVTQVILIGDMPPNTRSEVRDLRDCVQSEGLVGSDYWAQKTPFVDQTDSELELKKIAAHGVPVHARYLKAAAKKAFTHIGTRTNGSSGELNIDNPQSGEQLTGIFAAGILRDIQKHKGAGAVTDPSTDLYQAYLAKHPFADVGFV